MAKEVKNLGRIDRVIRMAITIVLAILILSNFFDGWGNITLFVLVAFFGYTSLASTCPIYRMIGKSTYQKKK